MSDPSSGFTYRAFISYAHRDKAWSDWLHRSLETYRVPARLVGRQTENGTIPRRLNPVFRDREELASATDLGRKVNEALGQSENLLVICSPAAATSHWVNDEVLAYKRMGRGERIFCLIVDGEPNATDLPGREAEECFCPALRFATDAEGRPSAGRSEPIAADARAGKDGRTNAKLKLIAGMLDVGFDALKQRDLQRRTRRMTAIAALAVAVMAVTSVLAVYALVSRHEAVIAERQAVVAQHKAVVAQQTAERRQKQAEGLVNFMLGDLNDKLAQVNRLDIMQAVDDKAMTYFKSLPRTDVTPEALAQRAKALEKIGAVRMDQGHLPAALNAFRASTEVSSRLAAEKPADAARQIAYARTLSYVGFTYWNQGNLAEAQRNFQTAKEALQRVQNDPSAEFELALVANNTGHVLEARGRLNPAILAYRSMLTLMRKLVLAEPDNTHYLPYLGTAYNDLGKTAISLGDLAESIAKYQADDEIETHLSARNPKDNNQRKNALRVHAILGRTLALAGDTAVGMHYLQQSVGMATQLNRFEPNDADTQDLLGLYSSQLAQLQRLSSDLPASQTSTARSVAILSELVHKEPGNSGWQSDLAGALIEQAAESFAANQRNVAHTQVQRALHILQPMLAKHPDDRDTLLATMTAKLLSADASANPKIAQSMREQALRQLQAVKTSRSDPRLLSLQVDTLLALSRKAEVQPLLKQLWNSGYRDPALLAVLHRTHIDYPINNVFAQRIAAILHKDHANKPHLSYQARCGNECTKSK